MTRPLLRRAVIAIFALLATVSCVPDTPPTVPDGSITIAGGVPAVRTTAVVLDLVVPAGATRMRVADGADPTSAPWQPAGTTLTWTLPAGDGLKGVSVQFGTDQATANPVSDEVVLDTVAPTITIDTHTSGAHVDLTDGRLVPLGGEASDVGTTITTASIALESESAPLELTDGRWAAPLGAPGTGAWHYVASAVDLAGNVGTTAIDLTVTMPPPGTTIVRPSTVDLAASPLGATIASVADDRVTFTGDQRAALSTLSTLVAGPRDGAPYGLLRHIDAIELQGGTTVVRTSQATLFDAYAQLAETAPVAARAAVVAPAAANAAPPTVDALAKCDEFANEPGVHGTVIPLESIHSDIPIIHDDPAQITLDLRLAVRFDWDLRYHMGTFLPEIDAFKAIPGVLLCGSASVSTHASIEQALGTPFEQGIGMDRLKAEAGVKFSLLTESIQNQLTRDLGTRTIDAMSFPIGGPLPITARPLLKLSLGAEPEFTIDSRFEASFFVGGTAGVMSDDGITGARPVVDGQRGGSALASVVGEAGIKGVLAGSLGLAFNPTFNPLPGPGNDLGTLELLTLSVQSGPVIRAKWANGIVGSSSHINEVIGHLESQARLDLHFAPEIHLDANLGLGIRAALRWAPVDIKFVGLAWDLPAFKLFEVQTGDDPPEITTPQIAGGEAGVGYSTQLEANVPVTWSLKDAQEVNGLTLSIDGELHGSPTRFGTSRFTVVARDALRRETEKEFTLVVGAPLRIAAGGAHACIVQGDGDLWCWGNGVAGQLGDGRSTTSASPVPVMSNVKRVAAGNEHTCAITTDGRLWCWGNNLFGQLGAEDFVDRNTPFQVPGITGAVDVAAGVAHTCVSLGEGGVQCWGNGSSGQLGVSNPPTDPPYRVQVQGLGSTTTATRVSAAGLSSCAYTPGEADLRCWGSNGTGQLGIGATPTRAMTAVDVPAGTVTAVAVGNRHACSLRPNGTARCWGSNAYGQVGDGASSLPAANVNSPTDVTGGHSYDTISAGGTMVCAVSAASSRHVDCWGRNNLGQLGNGGSGDSSSPVAVSNMDDAKFVAAGAAFACAERRDNTIWCWGQGSSGQLGNGETPGSSDPVRAGVRLDG